MCEIETSIRRPPHTKNFNQNMNHRMAVQNAALPNINLYVDIIFRQNSCLFILYPQKYVWNLSVACIFFSRPKLQQLVQGAIEVITLDVKQAGRAYLISSKQKSDWLVPSV